MADLQTLEQKVKELEERVNKLESRVAALADTSDKELMDALYTKARELVIKNKKATTIFLQKRLIIDMARAKKLMDELERDGVVGPDLGVEPRIVLVSK